MIKMTITKKVLENTFDLYDEVGKDRKLYLYAELKENKEVLEKTRQKTIQRINNYLHNKELKPAERDYLESLKQEYSKLRQKPTLKTKLMELDFDEKILGKICAFLNQKYETKSITPGNVTYSYLENISEKELLETKGFGLKSVHEIKNILEKRGFKLKKE